MRNSLIYFFAVLALFSSCKKDDKSVFNQSADDRLNATLAKYQTQLSGAQYGWKGLVFPAGGGAFSFYFKFNDSNRVKMLSDFDSTTAVTLKESSYRLKALQQPSLIFDTYSYIHLPADPNENVGVISNVNGGPVGVGLQSDFEFYFDSTTVDTIKLVGRFNGSKAILIRATSQEATAYNSGQLAAGLLIKKILTYFKRVTIGTQRLDVKVSAADRTIIFSYLDAGGNLHTFTTGFYFTAGGIAFINPLVIGNVIISSFNNMQFNATTEVISLTVNNVASTLTGVVVPVKVDIAAPKRWWDYAVTNNNDYWISYNGFHVNGVDDAYGINSLRSGDNTYFYLIYWPAYTTANDFFGPIFLNAARTSLTLVYGTAPQKPTFTADGRAVFIELGNYGTHPATGAAALTRTKLYNSSGYYFVQTSATSYDMVSALDGKSWITWDF
jgi:hypothetical protein